MLTFQKLKDLEDKTQNHEELIEIHENQRQKDNHAVNKKIKDLDKKVDKND